MLKNRVFNKNFEFLIIQNFLCKFFNFIYNFILIFNLFFFVNKLPSIAGLGLPKLTLGKYPINLGLFKINQ